MENIGSILKRAGFVQPEDKPSLPTFKNWAIDGDIYVDDRRFCDDILSKAESIDCITYTANALVVDSLPVAKLIVGQMEGRPNGSTEIRWTRNVHSKLYLVTKKRRMTAWLGSMNLVIPGGWHNIMIKASQNQTESFVLYFNRLWSLHENINS